MKKILYLFVILSLASCKKEELATYTTVEDPIVENNWEDEYVNGGTLPDGVPQTNDLVGTKWVLTKYVSGFASEYPNDTLDFVNNHHYTLNSGSVRSYQLGNIPSSTNKDLTLQYFAPFGGSHYTAQVGLFFVDDGELNNIEFEDIQNSSKQIRAWFKKIN